MECNVSNSLAIRKSERTFELVYHAYRIKKRTFSAFKLFDKHL